jgi:outer membrane lipoprotein carrier protein
LRMKACSKVGAVAIGLFLMSVVPAAAAVGTAPASDPASLISRLQHHYRTTDAFTAHFVETLTSPGGAPRQRRGTIAYRKPGMIRWEFDPPQPETIVADGTTLYDYDPGLNQVVEMSERSAFKNRSVAAFILGVGDLSRDFDGQTLSASASDGLARLLLTPKDGSAKIELGLDSKTLNITRLRTADSLGNTTELRLADIQRNVTLATSMFTFTVPRGADIVNAAPGR